MAKSNGQQQSRAQMLRAIAQIEAGNHQQLLKLIEVSTKHAEQNKKGLEGIQKGLDQIYEKQADRHRELIDEVRRLMIIVASGILIGVAVGFLVALT